MTASLIVYHGDCLDGFTAAWSAWRRLGHAPRYLPAFHGAAPVDVAGEDVVMLDFAYPRPTMLALAERAGSLLVLDHHKTALDELADLPYVTLDMNQSGAGMAWRHFHPHDPVPRLVLAVEDGDLWRHEFPATRDIYLRLSLEPRTFSNWNRIAALLERDTDFASFVAEGRLLREEREFQVERLVLRRHEVLLGGEEGLGVEAPAGLRSEVGHRPAELSGTFGLVWYGRGETTRVSLRSIGDFDVERLARRYGGGGHRNAAGFSLPNPAMLRTFITV